MAQTEDFAGEVAEKYDAALGFRNLAVIMADILLHVTPSFDGLDSLDFRSVGDLTAVPLEPEQIVQNVPGDSLLTRPGAKIMDFGCGTGLIISTILDHCAADADIVGVDVSADMLAQFDSKFHADARVRSFCSKDDPELTGVGSGYDVIFSTLAFHHLPDWKASLAALTKSLKPGGYLVICDFHKPDAEHEAPGHGAPQHGAAGHGAAEHGHGHGHTHRTPSKRAFNAEFNHLHYSGKHVINTAPFVTYMPLSAVLNHNSDATYAAAVAGKLPTKTLTDIRDNVQDFYLVESQLVLAIGRK